MTALKNFTLTVLDVMRLLGGVCVHLATGKTPARSYQSMISLFCRSGGRSNDMLTAALKLFGGRVRLPRSHGVLGDMQGDKLDRVVQDINEHGYCLFEKALPDDMCDRLLAFALDTPSLVRPLETSGTAHLRDAQRVKYDRRNPMGVRYDFSSEDVINNPDVQQLMADASILSIAQAYLGSAPIADVTSMWWHTAFSDQPNEEAAQFFHFDMDRIKWLKFFIYLTDVGPDNGPHSFVRGSHRTGGIPATLLSKGYARLSDGEVNRHYDPRDVVAFLAPRGTVLAEDTRGLHKGHAVLAGDRLMLQLQFSNSLFGGAYPPAMFRTLSKPLRDMVGAFPRVYGNYLGYGR
jgi:ectoine hydroxylase-related dioxygenase (phytanoyl-CoA dioxygenase family)